MMYPYYNYGYGFGAWDFAWHIVGIVLAIWVVSMIVRMIFWGPRRGRHWRRHMNWHTGSALEILDERYAKGEISKEEYEERKKTLMSE